jgi:hypothetical protein
MEVGAMQFMKAVNGTNAVISMGQAGAVLPMFQLTDRRDKDHC